MGTYQPVIPYTPPPVPPPVLPPASPPVVLNINVEESAPVQETTTYTILCSTDSKSGKKGGSDCYQGYGGKKGSTGPLVIGGATTGNVQYVYGVGGKSKSGKQSGTTAIVSGNVATGTMPAGTVEYVNVGNVVQAVPVVGNVVQTVPVPVSQTNTNVVYAFRYPANGKGGR